MGAVATAFLFTIGKSLIGWYMGASATASAYGATGALMVVLLWIYYSTQIFLLGAEFTRAWATMRRALKRQRAAAAPAPAPAPAEPRLGPFGVAGLASSLILLLRRR